MKHLRSFNEDIHIENEAGGKLTPREKELILIALSGCSEKKKIENVLSEKIGNFSYSSKEELMDLIDSNLSDLELENLFLNIFNK